MSRIHVLTNHLTMATDKRGLICLLTLSRENPHVHLPLSFEEYLQEKYELIATKELESQPQRCKDVEAFIIFPGYPIDVRALFESLVNLKVVVLPMLGTDLLPLQFMKERGIRLGSPSGMKHQRVNVAEYAMLLMLAHSRDLFMDANYVKNNPGKRFSFANLGYELSEQVLGIVGLGKIGMEVAKRAVAFEMKILYHNRKERPDAAGIPATFYSSLADMLPHCDYVLVACPLHESSHGLIGAEQLQRMKKTALLVNIARGAIVNTEALVDALRNGQIRGAALDVTEPEPLPEGHPLLTMDNVLLTPHAGFKTLPARKEASESVFENLRSFFQNPEQRMPYEVDF